MKTYLLLLQLFLVLSLSEGLGGLVDRVVDLLKVETKEEEEDCGEKKCKRTCYRPFDGYCNNLKNPFWGTPETLFRRMFDSNSYEDGKCEMPCLTNPRKISSDFVDIPVLDLKWTLNVVKVGQILAHDVSAASGIGSQDITCPCVDGKLTNKLPESDRCFPIKIPKCDPYFYPEGVECFDFIRTRSTCEECPDKPGEQYNAVTSFIDCSFVYGNSEEESNTLRKFKHGLLDYVMMDGRMYPPQATDEGTCNVAGASKPLCLVTGDFRANQNPHTVSMQCTLLRQHNHIAKILSKLNPHWDDEICFQEARRIVIAEFQRIMYYEWLPIIIGEKNMEKCNLNECLHKGHVKGYNDTINPSAINEYATAAGRSFHSAINGVLMKYDDDRKEHGIVHMSNAFNNGSLMREYNTEMQIVIGAATQPQLLVDRYYHSDFTVRMFKRADKNVGVDLHTIDIMRARDHGLATYAYAHERCGLGKIKSFDDLIHISPKNRKILKRHYDCPEQIELSVGAQLETLIRGTLSGPVNNCIMKEQYKALKFGDYYWYEFKQEECYFTEEQLKEIEKSSISRLMCTFNGMFSIQPRGFEVPSSTNKIGPCVDLPEIDLTKWKEDCPKD